MIHYEITGREAAKALWGEAVYTQHAMDVSDVFVGMERARVLVEVTARENIADFLERLRRWLATQS